MNTRKPMYAPLLFLLILLQGCGDGGASKTNLPKRTTQATVEAPPPAPLIEDIGKLDLTSADGETVQLASFLGKQNVILIISRGYFGSICPYCNSQVQQIALKYSEIEKLNARVVVVFPVSTPSENQYRQELETMALEGLAGMSKLPFPILLDMQLNAVDQLGIRDQLAKPSTYIIDTEGKIRYSHVGRHRADRPAIETLIKQLQGL